MRTFALDAGRSYKFWNIDLRGSALVLAFGEVGRQGRSETRSFASAELARAEYDRLIAERLGKGYVETTAPEQPTLPPAVSLRDGFERAILADPMDLASHAAYADWLSEQESPADVARAELIRLHLAQGGEARARELIGHYQREWAGPWVDLVSYDGPTGRGQLDFPEPRPVRWVRGLPAEVVFDRLSFRCAAAFVACPEGWLVRKLFLGGFAWEEPDEATPIPPALAHLQHLPASAGAFEALKRWPGLAHLRTFQFGWTSDEEYGDGCDFQCHQGGSQVHELIAKTPRLEELYLFAHHVNGAALFALPLPYLRVLQVYHSHDYPLEVLAANATLTSLTHLLLHPHAIEGPVPLTLDGLRAVARSPHLRSLTHLRLRLTVFGDEGVREIVDSGLLGRLKVLDLRHGRVSDAGAKLLAASPAVKGLELLDLSRNELTEEGIAELQATGVQLRSEYQHASTASAGVNPTDYDGMQFLAEGDYE